MDMIVVHYTAGGSLNGAIETLTKPGIVSAHVVIGRDGRIVQLVPFDTVAWHAGKSVWQGRSGVNIRSLGIELDNWGPLECDGGVWRSWTKTRVPTEQVTCISGSDGWHAYTEPQIQSAVRVCRVFRKLYNIQFVVGHSQVSPGRKFDPGPAFPMGRLKQECGMGAA